MFTFFNNSEVRRQQSLPLVLTPLTWCGEESTPTLGVRARMVGNDRGIRSTKQNY